MRRLLTALTLIALLLLWGGCLILTTAWRTPPDGTASTPVRPTWDPPGVCTPAHRTWPPTRVPDHTCALLHEPVRRTFIVTIPT